MSFAVYIRPFTGPGEAHYLSVMPRPLWISVLSAIIVAPIVFWGRAHPDTWPIGVPLMLAGGFAFLVFVRLVTGRWPN